MAKGAYGGVNDLSRKTTNIYGGVSGSSRKIVKGYAGVNGVARQFWPAVNPPAEIYTFYKNGVFDHVPSGFDFNNNQQNVIYSSGYADIKPYLDTNKTVWLHDADYIRAWSNNGTVINSNFVYDADIPTMDNYINFPTWDGTYTDENRAKIPSAVSNYYLKVVGLGYFSIRLFMLDSSRELGFQEIRIDGGSINSDQLQTITARIYSELGNRYIDRIDIHTFVRTFTKYNAWLESIGLRYYDSTIHSWSGIIDTFRYGYKKFEIFYYGGYPERVVAETILSDAQVYSISWRHATDTSYPMYTGAELLSRAAFTVHCVAYNYNGTIYNEETVPATQVMYNGLAFYRYRYDIGKSWYRINEWYPQPVGDNVMYGLFAEDGRLEYEFYQSVEEIYNTAQISEISIITQ